MVGSASSSSGAIGIGLLRGRGGGRAFVPDELGAPRGGPVGAAVAGDRTAVGIGDEVAELGERALLVHAPLATTHRLELPAAADRDDLVRPGTQVDERTLTRGV